MVESTHEAGATVRRLRKCEKCGKQITTHEKPDAKSIEVIGQQAPIAIQIADILPHHPRMTAKTRREYLQAQRRACMQVRGAKRKGELPKLNEIVVACMDCGKRATVYDHRDYSKPLEVSPVCDSCNLRRGQAKIATTER